MSTLFHTVATVSDWLIGPLVRLHPLVAMVVVSVVTAVGVLIVYKYTSNQTAMTRVKDEVKASFYAISLYQDSLRVILTSAGRITKDNLHYLALNLVPLAVMILPVTIVMVQLDGWFGHAPLEIGQKAVVTASFEETDVLREDISLSLPEGLVLDAPPVRVPETGEIAWRVRATAPGRHEVRIAVGGETASKSLPVDVEGTRIELVRHAGGLSNGFLHPGEAPIRTAGVASISVDLAGAEMDLWGWHVHWIWVFLVLTLVAALAMKDLFKVTF